MLQYKCMAHLNIATLLVHFTKEAGEGDKIQEMLTKDPGDFHMENKLTLGDFQPI